MKTRIYAVPAVKGLNFRVWTTDLKAENGYGCDE